MPEALLHALELSRSFGGLAAVDGVSLACETGKVHAVIGPNGAGKSTLINLLSGELPADGGEVWFDGHEITGLPAHRVSQLGIARSYQKINLFLPLSARENCRLAAQSRLRGIAHLFRPQASRPQVDAAAMDALGRVGMAGRADARVADLSHGERRQVEIAMVLATRPRVLLLDEPLAGMGHAEAVGILALLKDLATDHAILLVEHDMDAVFALADTLTVMVNGRLLESGPPAQIRASRAVQEAYLGTA
ncbi:MAG TPA: ABC transporter ATP-binding protein [Burkholderiales bacterium]|nr:ABC transporter ATP-binding protein [Burkholderiales bacterium]